MKDDKCFTVGKNLDEMMRIKDKTKAGTGRSNDNWSAITKAIEKGEITSMKQVREMDPEIAAMREEYWRSLIVESQPKPAPKPHPLRPWHVMLDKKLDDPFSDREVIFVVDETGGAGKSWFADHHSQTRGRICCDVPADK